MSTKRSLMEKYDIPVSHLDYGHIDECVNPKEMERIVTILRSGAEGYFPDLTKYAEDKLKSLKPLSKILRTEIPLSTKDAMTSSEWKEINEPFREWINSIRKKDRVLANTPKDEKDTKVVTPPLREGGTIDDSDQLKEEAGNEETKNDRIKSLEYSKWDKYDADTEELKIDLEEEKAKERVERMNRLNLKKSVEVKSSTIDVVDVEKLTTIEKETLAMKYKDRGNDYFRAKEYKEAILEYTQCINVLPSVNGYNNRALGYLKLNEFKNCIEDCDRCLEIEPNNLKALLRKAQAYLGLDDRRTAYTVYAHILSFHPNNATACAQVRDLQKELPDLPPVSATRISIVEEEENSTLNTTQEKIHSAQAEIPAPADSSNKNQTISKSCDMSTKAIMQPKQHLKPVEENNNDDLSKLIMPNKIVKSKLKTAVEAFGTIQKQTKSELQKVAKEKMTKKPAKVKILSDEQRTENKTVLIEEI